MTDQPNSTTNLWRAQGQRTVKAPAQPVEGRLGPVPQTQRRSVWRRLLVVHHAGLCLRALLMAFDPKKLDIRNKNWRPIYT